MIPAPAEAPVPSLQPTGVSAGRTLVLGLGNDVLADDAVGILVARALGEELAGVAEVRETAEHGIALLDHFLGFERAVIVDAIQTRRHPPGTILELDPDRLAPVLAPSPHYAGLPEMLVLARELALEFPEDLAIVAVEIADGLTLGGAMTPAVRRAIPAVCQRVRQILGLMPVPA